MGFICAFRFERVCFSGSVLYVFVHWHFSFSDKRKVLTIKGQQIWWGLGTTLTSHNNWLGIVLLLVLLFLFCATFMHFFFNFFFYCFWRLLKVEYYFSKIRFESWNTLINNFFAKLRDVENNNQDGDLTVVVLKD